MINHSEQISNIAAALLKAQRDIGHVLKAADNPYYKSHYADLTAVIDSVKDPLNKNGIAFLQAVDSDNEGKPVIDTILLHESGQYLSTITPVFCKKPDDPQAFGSGVTYSKRYALQAILGLPTEDDDAEKATDRGSEQRKPAAHKAPTTPAAYTPPATPATTPAANKEAIKAANKTLVEQAFFEYQTVHANEMPDGKIFCLKYFDTEFRAAFKGLTSHQKKSFKWEQASVNKLAETILPANCLTDIQIASDA